MTDHASGKVVWITGAGKGIGRALAVRMAREGWTVAASARTESDLQTLVDECAPATVRAYPLDVTDQQANCDTLQRIEGDLGPVALAVLNAGTHKPVSAQNFDVDAIRFLIDTNLLGTVYGLQPLIAAFRARKTGHVAIVSSVAGYRGLPSSAGYGATKAALINMCEALQPELKREGVKLSLINPGFVETPLTSKNRFPMPFLITADQAANYMFKGLMKGRFEIVFPLRFAILMKLMRVLPNRLLFSLTSRMVPKK